MTAHAMEPMHSLIQSEADDLSLCGVYIQCFHDSPCIDEKTELAKVGQYESVRFPPPEK